MIKDILSKVNNQIGGQLAEQTGISVSDIPQALQLMANTVISKGRDMVSSGNLIEIKEIFIGGDSDKRTAFFAEIKTEIGTNLNNEMGIDVDAAHQLVDQAVPHIINSAKEQLLGPNGKFDFTDIPRIMNFFKG